MENPSYQYQSPFDSHQGFSKMFDGYGYHSQCLPQAEEIGEDSLSHSSSSPYSVMSPVPSRSFMESPLKASSSSANLSLQDEAVLDESSSWVPRKYEYFSQGKEHSEIEGVNDKNTIMIFAMLLLAKGKE